MTNDIFDFWSVMKPGELIHPADNEALERLDHHFDLRCLPGCFAGPLRTAPVVLLYLAPGWAPEGLTRATEENAILQYARTWQGNEPLPGPGDPSNPYPGWVWRTRITKIFAPWQELQTRLAILNIAPYQSPGTFKDYKALRVLPSCRVTLEWAHSVLFPQAKRGERIVVCMRSAKHWGLQRGTQSGQLYAPATARSGHMEHGPMREEIVAAIRKAISEMRNTSSAIF